MISESDAMSKRAKNSKKSNVESFMNEEKGIKNNTTMSEKKEKSESSNDVVPDVSNNQMNTDGNSADFLNGERATSIELEPMDVEEVVQAEEPVKPIDIEEFDKNLPKTVTLLRGQNGSKLYLIGTAHFSVESQEDVGLVIRTVRPQVVVVELCRSRADILSMDEKTIEREAKSITFEKMRQTFKEHGLMLGLMYFFLLNLSADLTKDLKMGPGGEFRRAFDEIKKIPGCRLHFGDRPIKITLVRASNVLTWWKALSLAWYLLFNKEKVSREDVETFKETDLLERLLEKTAEDFPELGKVFVEERDIFLTYSLQCATDYIYRDITGPIVPTVAVGIVGMGHIPGIKRLWQSVKESDIPPIFEEVKRKPSILGKTLKYGFFVFVGYQVFKRVRTTSYFQKLPQLLWPK